MKVPNFFIVGAPKAGTTSLYAYLDQHPQIYLSPLKEPHFFAAEFRPDNFEDEARPRVATEQAARYLRELPPARVHVALYDDLQRAPERLLAQVFEFLDVDAGFAPDLSRRHHEPVVPKLATAAYWLKRAGVWPRGCAILPAALRARMRSLLARPRADLVMRPEDRAFLADYYRDDVAKLAALLGRDLTAWL